MMLTRCCIAMLCVCLSLVPSFGQRDYFPGYVVLNSGDTLKGLVRDRKEGQNRSSTQVKMLKRLRVRSETSSRKRIAYGNILSYQRGDALYQKFRLERARYGIEDLFNERWRVVPGRGTPVFLRTIHLGALSYYSMDFQESDGFDATLLFKREDREEFVSVIGLTGLRRKALANYFYDCLDLVAALESKNVREPIQIVDFYEHNCAKPPAGKH